MIYFIADTHLTPRVWKFVRALEGDAFRSWSRFWQAVLADPTPESKAVFCAGDIFDANKVDGSTLDAFTSGVDALYSAGVPLYFIQGNHDFNVKPIAEVQGAHWLKEPVEFDGRRVGGLDYLPKEALVNARFPACDILLLHCIFSHVIRSEISADLSMEQLPEYVKNVVVGDVHIADLTQFGDRWCLSPGALHPCDVGQGGDHGFWRLGRNQARPEFQAVPGRAIERYRVCSLADLDLLEERLRTMPEHYTDFRPIVEVRYANDYTEKVLGVLRVYADKAVYFESSAATGKLGLTQTELAAARSVFQKLDLVSALPKVVSMEKEPAVYNLLERLLAPGAQAAEIIDAEVNAVCAQ